MTDKIETATVWNRECVICAHKWQGDDTEKCPACIGGATHDEFTSRFDEKMFDFVPKMTNHRSRQPAGIVMTDLAHKCAEYVRSDAVENAKTMASVREQLARIYPEAAEIEDEWWGSEESHG